MALSRDEILVLPALHDHIQEQLASLIGMFNRDQRLSALFATQQRWLMSHIALSLYFRSRTATPPGNLHLSAFLDAVRSHGVASRNTADAYMKEMIRYNYAAVTADPGDRRLKPLAPASTVIEAVCGWLHVHLTTLDRLDGGARRDTFLRDTTVIAYLQPLIADGLLVTNMVRYPEKTFSLFTWLDNGGLVMDWLITNMERAPADPERVRVGTVSVSEMATRLNLSRTHLARKLNEAEMFGSIGWDGRRGQSGMWVSGQFRREYAAAQAIKLEIIDTAWETVMGQRLPAARSAATA